MGFRKLDDKLMVMHRVFVDTPYACKTNDELHLRWAGPPPKNICIFQSSNPRDLLRCYVQQNQEASGADCKSLGRVCFDTVSRNMGVSWKIHKERV